MTTSVRMTEERIEIPIQGATHLDRAVGQLGSEGPVAIAQLRSPRAVVERRLRATIVQSRLRKDILHHGECEPARPFDPVCAVVSVAQDRLLAGESGDALGRSSCRGLAR